MTKITSTGYWVNPTLNYHAHSPKLAKWISEFLENEKDIPVIDMGCGLGDYLVHLQNKGFKTLLGIEGEKSNKVNFKNIINQDLTVPFDLTKEYKGNVISLEVGEHIPKQYQKQYLDNLDRHCNNFLIMSWAIKNQPGLGHVNCMDNDEIIPIIENMGYNYLPVHSSDARINSDDFTPWFKNTILIFKKNN